MKGFWLDRSTGIYATQRSPYQFDKLANTLNRKGTNSKNRQFFIPEMYCTEDWKMKNIPVEEDIDSDALDELVANVDFNNSTDQETDELNKALKRARLDKTLADTKLVEDKLSQRKKLLFAEWSQKFFDQFSNHFGKLRNCLVQLHLNEQQVAKFNETLDNCINNLQLSLDNIWEDVNREEKEE